MRATATPTDPVVVLAQFVCLLKVAVLLLAFDPLAADVFTLPKSQLSHELGFLLAALIIWIALVRRPWPITLSPLHYATGAMLVAFLLATPGALDTQVALFGADRRYLGLTQVIDSAVLFAGVAYLFRTARDVLVVAGSIAVLAVGVVAYAVAQRIGADPVHFSQSTVRPISTLGQPDFLAPFMSAVAGTCIATLILMPSRLRVARVMMPVGALTAACLYVAYAAGTRSSILAIAGAAVATLALVLHSGWRSRRTAGAAGLFVIALGAILLSPLASRITPAALEADRTVAGRLEVWTTAIRMTEGRVLLGVGPDNFAVGYPRFRAESSVDLNGVDALQNNPHDWLLYAYTSAGLIGAAAALFLAIVPPPLALRLARRGHPGALAIVPLYAYLAQGLVNVNDIGIDWIQWVCLGLLAGASGGSALRVPSKSRSEVPGTVGWLLAGALVIAAAIELAPIGRHLRASEDIAAVQALITAKKPLDAVRAGSEAVQLDAARGHSWSAFGTSLAAAGNANAAQRAFIDAASREPWQPQWWRNAGFQAFAQGDDREAAALLLKAVDADPMDSTSLDLLSRLGFNRGDFNSTLEYGRRAVRLLPNSVAVYDAPVRAALQLHRTEDAKDILIPAVARTNDPHLRVLLAQTYLDAGDVTAAKSQIEMALKIAPNDPEVIAAAKTLESR